MLSSIKLMNFVTNVGEEGLFKVPYLISKVDTNDILLFKNKMSQSTRKKQRKTKHHAWSKVEGLLAKFLYEIQSCSRVCASRSLLHG